MLVKSNFAPPTRWRRRCRAWRWFNASGASFHPPPRQRQADDLGHFLEMLVQGVLLILIVEKKKPGRAAGFGESCDETGPAYAASPGMSWNRLNAV